MKKRFVSLLLAISMILSLMPVSAVTAFAEGENSGAVEIIANGNCGAENNGANLSWKLDNNGVLTITGNGPMEDYDYYNSPGWYQHTKEIASVVFDGGITRIGDLAFDDCTNIKNVSYTGYKGTANNALPESVTKIGYGAFRDAGVTGKLELPKNLTAIGAYAFYRCKNLTGPLTIPENVTKIGYYTFSGCSGLTGPLTIPKGVTTIEKSAFEGCESLTGPLTIPEGVKTIGESAFNGCKNLTGDLKIPDTVTAIGKDAFYQCSGFDGKLSLSENLKEICSDTFWGCSGLTGPLTIPENVTKIGSCAFRECENLTGDLYIPDTVTEVGGSAFEWCSGFNGTIHISKSLKEIEEATFKNCSSLTGTLTIPDGVTTIKRESFSNCSQLKGKLVIPDSVTVIYGGGYDSTKIWDGAFEDCKGFTALQLSNRLTRIPEYVFDGCSGLTGPLTIPESVTEIGYYAFSGCKGLTGPLTIPDQVKKIGKGAFEECTGLTGDLTIPKNVTTIDKNAFYDCGFTESVDFSQAENLTVIDEGAFEGCKNLKKVYLSNHITSIRQDAFERMGTAKIYYPNYKDAWLELAKHVSDLNADKNAFISSYSYIDPMPVCYYCDVTFDPKGGTFADNTTTAKTYQKIYRTELVETNEEHTPVPANPTRTGYTFNGWYYLDATQQKVTFDPATDGVPDTMTLYADWKQTGTTAAVAISGINADEKLIKGREYPFTVTVTPNDDTGAGKLNFGLLNNAELWYKDTADQWEKVDNSTLNIDFDTTEYQFKLVPKESGDNTLTVGVQKDGMTTDTANDASVSFTVRDPKAAEIAIAELDGETIKQNKPHTFTVTVTTNDDSGDMTVKFDSVKGLIYNNAPVTAEGIAIEGLTAGKTKTLNLIITPAEAGNGKTLKATLSNAVDVTATYNVSAYEHAKVTIDGLDTDLKQGESKDFTVNVDPKDDSDKGPGKLNFGNKNEEIEWKNPNPADPSNPWEKIPADGLTVDFSSSQSSYKLRITPKTDGEQSLTATVTDKNDNKLAECQENYTVAAYVNAAIAITPATANVETDTAQEFEIKVTANDDANTNVTAKAVFTGPAGGVKKLEYEFNGNWKDVTDQNLELNLNSLQSGTYKIRVTFAAAGEYKLNASLTKADDTVASSEAGITVTAKLTPAPNPNPGEDGGNTNPGGNPGGGSTGGGENPGENPGGNPGSGSTTPKRKLEIADGTLTSVMVKDENGNLKDITDTITKDLDGKYEIPVGAKVTITAKDAPEGMKFGEWSISDKTLLGDPDVPYTEKDLIFTMPDNSDGVKLSVVYLEESIGEEPNLLEKGALAGTVVVGSAALLYQGHMLGTELYLRYLLPHGAVIPQNRAELAVLLWQDAENPEPVSTTLYSDISDEDSAIQQAARWAVENDLMEQLDADEHPDHFDPFVPVTFSDSIRAWKKAQELKKSVH